MDRLDEFRAVHSGEGLEEIIDAMSVMMESVGITETSIIDLMDYLYGKNGHGQEGGFLIGLILGIMAHRHMTEREA